MSILALPSHIAATVDNSRLAQVESKPDITTSKPDNKKKNVKKYDVGTKLVLRLNGKYVFGVMQKSNSVAVVNSTYQFLPEESDPVRHVYANVPIWSSVKGLFKMSCVTGRLIGYDKIADCGKRKGPIVVCKYDDGDVYVTRSVCD